MRHQKITSSRRRCIITKQYVKKSTLNETAVEVAPEMSVWRTLTYAERQCLVLNYRPEELFCVLNDLVYVSVVMHQYGYIKKIVKNQKQLLHMQMHVVCNCSCVRIDVHTALINIMTIYSRIRRNRRVCNMTKAHSRAWKASVMQGGVHSVCLPVLG